MSLDIIIGPMFAGKTTELIRRLNTFVAISKRCVYINSIQDVRNHKENFSTHNPSLQKLGQIDSIKTNMQQNNTSFMKTAKELIHNKRIFNGLSLTLTRAFMLHSFVFLGYEVSKKYIQA